MKRNSLLFFFLYFGSLFLMGRAFSSPMLEWKILIYMQADNDLAPYALLDLKEASSVSENSRLKVFAHLDLPQDKNIYEFEVLEKYSGRTDFENFSNFKYSESLLNQPQRLKEFLLRYEELYPSKHTMLVIWGHGEGWSAGKAGFGGLALDQSPKSRLGIEEVRKAVEERNQFVENKLAILAMDACLMQSIEVLHELRLISNYFVGSAQVQTPKGLPYGAIIRYIEKGLKSEATLSDSGEDFYLAKKIPELFESSYASINEFATESIGSLSAQELERSFLPSFNTAMNSLSDLLESAPLEALGIKLLIETTPFFLGNSRDLGSLLASLEDYLIGKNFTELATLFAIARKALSYSTLSISYGQYYFDEHSEYPLGAYSGIGIWLPANKYEFDTRFNDFLKSDLYLNPYFQGYRRFLRKLYIPQRECEFLFCL